MATGILSPTHLLVVLVVALIVLGPKRLPGAGRAIGQSMREFKDSISGTTGETESPGVPALLGGADVSTMQAPMPAREPVSVAHDSTPMATTEAA